MRADGEASPAGSPEALCTVEADRDDGMCSGWLIETLLLACQRQGNGRAAALLHRKDL